MKKAILYSLSFILLLFSSCGEDSKLAKEEIFYIQEENLQWITNDNYRDVFVVKDSNGISSSFTMNYNNHEFTSSWSAFLGITTNISKAESYTQEYKNSNNYELNYSIILTASWDDIFGDRLSINMGRINIQYDLLNQTVFDFYSDWGNKNYTITEDGYEKNGQIYSYIEFLDNYTLGDTLFEKVMHVKFNDFTEYYTDYTPTDLYIAPKIGLIRYVLNNRISANREF